MNILLKIQMSCYAITGLFCLIYATLALWHNTPNPMPFWIPFLLGISTFIVISIFRSNTTVNSTEKYKKYFTIPNMNAQSYSYWLCLLLYPFFGMLIFFGFVSYPVAFAAMGTLTGSIYLISCILFQSYFIGKL